MTTERDDELEAHARERVGTVLCGGKYRIDRVLGAGGMATVYAGTHRNGRRVALKLLHPELSIRSDMRKRFLREGHAANAVEHPGAVIVIDDDVTEDGAAFLVMELLEGQSLEEVWRDSGGRIAPKMALAIGRELCDVLAAAHDAGIVHRDIKPANLFVTADGRLKVLDFGLARLRDAMGTTATATGLVFGTPAFLPPEQAAGRTSMVDAQTDVWAVGATLFTILSGKTVHEGESAQNLVMLSATTPPRSLATVLPDADIAIVTIVDRALAFDKGARWKTAREMHAAIRTACEDLFGDPDPQLVAMSSGPDAAALGMRTLESARGSGLVGTRTSQPVSSAPTKPIDRGRQARGGRAARAFALAETAIASVSMSTLTWTRRARTAVLIGAAVGVLLAAAIVLTFRARHGDSTPVPVSTVLTASDPDRAGAVEDVPPGHFVGSPSSTAPADAVSNNTGVVPVADAGEKRAPAATIAPTLSRPMRHAPTRQAPPSAPPHKPSANCVSPSYVDANGKTIWKPECL